MVNRWLLGTDAPSTKGVFARLPIDSQSGGYTFRARDRWRRQGREDLGRSRGDSAQAARGVWGLACPVPCSHRSGGGSAGRRYPPTRSGATPPVVALAARTALSNIYRNPDGSSTAELYDGPVNFRRSRCLATDRQQLCGEQGGRLRGGERANSFKVRAPRRRPRSVSSRSRVATFAGLLGLHSTTPGLTNPMPGRDTGPVLPGVDLQYRLSLMA